MGSGIWWDERLADGWPAADSVHDTDEDQRALETAQGGLTATIDLDDEYVRQLVLEGFARRPGWRVSCIAGKGEDISTEVSSSDLHWGEYERIDWERVHQGEQVASCYCVRKGLIRKAHLAHNLKKWAAKHPEGWLARAVPETLVMVLDDIDYFEEALSDVYEVRDMADGSQIWIAKPSITNQAIGVCIFDRVKQIPVAQLRGALEQHPDLREWVLQRYIGRPLLVGGRKFHLRAYVLCIGSLQCYVYSEMLALFAALPYSRGQQDLHNLDAHLTNTCHISRSSHKEYQEEEVVKLSSELPQVLSQEGMDLDEAEHRVAQMHENVNAIVGECMEAVSSELTFFTLPNCFELFGFDLLVDECWNVWLLEANAEPDMKQTGQRLQGIIAGLVEGILQLVADPLTAEQTLLRGDAQDGCTAIHTSPSSDGHWVKVLEKAQRGEHAGASGMSFS